jgi:hypothetical protein
VSVKINFVQCQKDKKTRKKDFQLINVKPKICNPEMLKIYLQCVLEKTFKNVLKLTPMLHANILRGDQNPPKITIPKRSHSKPRIPKSHFFPKIVFLPLV